MPDDTSGSDGGMFDDIERQLEERPPSPALSPAQRARAQGLWSQLEHGLVYLVVDEGQFLVERPVPGGPPEGTLRVWTDENEAWACCAEYRENFATGERTTVISCTLERLWQLRRHCADYYSIPVRMELCAVREGEPVVLDTLSSPLEDPN